MQIAHGHPDLFQGNVEFSVVHYMPRKPWLSPTEPARDYQHLIAPYEQQWWDRFDVAVARLDDADRAVVLAQCTGARLA